MHEHEPFYQGKHECWRRHLGTGYLCRNPRAYYPGAFCTNFRRLSRPHR